MICTLFTRTISVLHVALGREPRYSCRKAFPDCTQHIVSVIDCVPDEDCDRQNVKKSERTGGKKCELIEVTIWCAI